MTAEAPKRRRTPARMKVGELEEIAGVSRDTIHFYVRAGLLPRPSKTGATVAWYDAGHVERIRTIRTLRASGLSLTQVRRLLDAGAVTLHARDLDVIARLLACAERPGASAAEDAAPDAGARATESALGLSATAADDPRLRAAIDGLSALPGASRAAAMAAARTVTQQLREATVHALSLLRTQVDGRGGDPGAVAASLAVAYAPLRAFATAAADALWRESLEQFALALVASLAARRTRARRG